MHNVERRLDMCLCNCIYSSGEGGGEGGCDQGGHCITVVLIDLFMDGSMGGGMKG